MKYFLEEPDYLLYQLYSVSTDETTIKRRYRMRVYPTILYFLFGSFLFWVSDIRGTILFTIIGLLWYTFYPVFFRKRYYKHYEQNINTNYQNKSRKDFFISFEKDDENHIYFKDESKEGKIPVSELKELIELETHFFLNLKSGSGLIIPKDVNKNDNPEKAAIELIALANRLDIPHTKDFDWKWE